jgi:ankyrin repeat protein
MRKYKHRSTKNNNNHHSNALNQTIIKAITNEDITTLRILLANGTNDETDGYSSLYYETKPSNSHLTQLLLTYDKLNWKNLHLNKHKDTVLHYSCRLGKSILVKLFLDTRNFNINERNNDGDTPLSIACDCGYTDITSLLIKYGANCNCENNKFKTPLILASELLSPFDVQMCKLLIEDGSALLNYQTNNFNHILLSASKFGNLELIRYLASLNVNLNLKFNDGATALMRACYYNYLDVVNFFIDNGASIEEKNNRQETPLYIAAYRGHFEIVELLIRKNANVNSEDIDGDTPLTVSCYEDKAEVISLLLKNNAFVNKKVILKLNKLNFLF